MKTVEITKKWAGREVGTVEDFYDETLAQAVVDAGHGEFVDRPAKTMDRAMEKPPRGKE